ncbi:Uncharacterised protein [Legionella sainthelensi]|nr:Uncharacterised protein [Legionella sainthelensi]
MEGPSHMTYPPTLRIPIGPFGTRKLRVQQARYLNQATALRQKNSSMANSQQSTKCFLTYYQTQQSLLLLHKQVYAQIESYNYFIEKHAMQNLNIEGIRHQKS